MDLVPMPKSAEGYSSLNEVVYRLDPLRIRGFYALDDTFSLEKTFSSLLEEREKERNKLHLAKVEQFETSLTKGRAGAPFLNYL